MKITILGEYAPYPGAGGATAGYLVRTAEGAFLIDCGSGVISQLGKHTSIEALSAVIITHYHADHVADLGVLQYACMVTQKLGMRAEPLPVYANREPAAKFKTVSYQRYVKGIPVDSKSQIHICGTEVTFAATKHAVPCLAVSVAYQGKKFVFSSDTAYSKEVELLASNADVFICEATWLDKDKGPECVGHLTAKEAGEMAKRARVRKLILTHIYPGYDREELQREAADSFGGKVEVAKGGMDVEV